MLGLEAVVEIIAGVDHAYEAGTAPEEPFELDDVRQDDPIANLAIRAELAQVEVAALRVLVAATLDREAYQALQHLASDTATGGLPIDAVVAVLEALGFDPLEALGAFATEAALVSRGLVEVQGAPGAPLLVRRASVPDRVVQFLVTGVPPQPEPWMTIEARRPADELCAVPVREGVGPTLIDALRTHLPEVLDGEPLWIAGPESSGRKTALAAVAAEHQHNVVSVPYSAALAMPLRRLVTTLQLEAILQHAIICVHDVEPQQAPAPTEGGLAPVASDAAIATMCEWMRTSRLPVVLTAAQVPSTSQFEHAPAVVQLGHASAVDLLALWRAHLPALDGIEQLATRFSLPPGRVVRAATEANRIAGAAGRTAATADDVAQAIGASVARQVEVLGTRIDDRPRWEDVILPEETLDGVRELIARVRHRHQVLDQWGFREKLAKGIGVAALFSGPPGTGKSLMASLIAKELGQDLYQIDLSRVVSKWIGETEKNLARVFDAAEGANIVLLFDEADALFSKRTEVKSSNDRHSNAEVNYLLQRVERFEGVCILTTNLEGSIDPAFKRRLAVRLTFQMPEKAERLQLWTRLMPSSAAIAKDVDFEALADEYELAGGNIRNAILRAAFLAASLGRPIDMDLLDRAIKLEYRDAGKLSSTGRLL
jgi:hypothetical protein